MMTNHITPRERQIMDLILDEKSSSQIAEILGISERTVETHRRSIYSKMGVNNVVGLVKRVLKNNK